MSVPTVLRSWADHPSPLPPVAIQRFHDEQHIKREKSRIYTNLGSLHPIIGRETS
jgi:hypothetical protein